MTELNKSIYIKLDLITPLRFDHESPDAPEPNPNGLHDLQWVERAELAQLLGVVAPRAEEG